MLAAGLFVLKIIGFILLGILGLLLAAILAVLLVPVRYRARGSYYGEAKGEASASWLLHILSCKVAYDGELDMVVRVFGFRVGGGKNGSSQDEETGETPQKTPDVPPDESSASEPKSTLEPKSTPPTPENLEEELSRELREEAAREEKSSGAHKRRKKKISFSFQAICDKLKEIAAKKEQLESFLKDEENKTMFHLLWRELKRLTRHTLPQKIDGRVKFGFDDPSTTGQVLMYLSPFYGLYARRFTLIPVFEEKMLEGEGTLKGRIRAGTFLASGVRVMMNKRFRTYLKQWRE